MRKLSAVLALLFVIGAPALFGASAASDVLLTSDGTLFIVEIVDGAELPEGAKANTALRLRTIQGDVETTSFVPASLVDGFSSSPVLTFDDESETLFIFWVRAPQITTSELVFSSLRDGRFSEATAIDLGLFRVRSNLRIAVTRYAMKEDSRSLVSPALAVHAVWWETTGFGEKARYALLSISNGAATIIEVRDLVDYLDANRNRDPLAPPLGFDPDVLRYPAIESAATQDRVEVLFGDSDTNRFHRVDIYPVLGDALLKPPVGVTRGELPVPSLDVVAGDSVSTLIGSAARTDVILFSRSAERIHYVHYDDGAWSAAHTIPVDDRVSESAAIEALRRLLVTH